MSEEYNRYDLGRDPEHQPETGEVKEEHSREESKETAFERKEAEQESGETEAVIEQPKKEEASQTATESSSYAFSYRKVGEQGTNQEQKESYTRTYTDPRREYRQQSAQENSQQTHHSPYGSYHFTSQIPPEPVKKVKKQPGFGRKVGATVALAALFGLVAGGVFLGVSYAGRQLLPEQETKQIENTKTTSETVDKPSQISQNTISGNSVSAVAKNVMPSVVSITGISIQEIPNYFGFGTQQYEGQSNGSGIIVGQNESELLIATNNHVVKDTNSITVYFTNQDGTVASTGMLEDTSAGADRSAAFGDAGTAVEAKIKGTDSDNDLAVVAVQLKDIPEDVLEEIKVAVIGDSDDLVIGEQVVAIGNALGYGQSVTSGYVSALNKKVSSENADSTFIQTDAAINPGNSGGALLNMEGQLIGINSAKIAADEVEGMGFAIPISKAQPILDNLMSKKTRDKIEDQDKAAYLGITCKNVTSDAAEYYNMPLGVYVDSVAEDGPAEEAGIHPGDIIRKIDGTSVETYDNLIEQLEYYEAGESIEFVFSRAEGGEYKEQTVTVKLGAKKDYQASMNNRRSNR